MAETIETAALGRPFQLGMLYDCRKDALVPGITLWDREHLEQNIAVCPDIGTELTVTTSDTIDEKSKRLDVNGELKLSLLAGNVQISGAARYFNDTKKSFKQERLMLHYRSSTKFEHLTMNHLAHAKMGHHEVFDYDIATHVVTAVRYGADAYFVFDRQVNEFEKEISKGGEGKINLEQLKKVFVSGDAQINIHVNEEEKVELKKLSCTFYGDFKLPSNPATLEDAVKVYTDLPKLIGENGEHAVPVKVWLFPLVKLDSSAGKLQRFINTDLIRAVESVFEALNVTDMKCSDLLQDTVAKTFSTFHNQVQTAQKFCSEYKQDFMRKLAVLLPEIRGGKTDIKHLTELLEAHHKSPFNAPDLQKWITVKEKKSNQLKAVLKQLCDLGAEVTDDIDTYLLDLNVENLIAYAFTCIEHQDPFLTKQEIYLNPSTVGNRSENTLDPSFQEKSLTLAELACMRNNLQIFSDLIALNKSQTTKFIVQSVAKTSSASCIQLYENGCNVVFCPPSKPASPTIESVTDDSITLKSSPSCSATLEMNLLYKMKQEKNWKTLYANKDTITDLQQGTAYEMKYEAKGKLNYIVESDVTTATTSKCELIQQVVADQMSRNPVLKYYTFTLGNTLGHDPGIEKKLHELIPGLKNVLNSEKCNFILIFLHFDLQAGTDIKEAVKILNTISANKPAVVVVLHHTSDPNTIVPDSSGAVNRKNTITVDLLFCKDMGLLTCYKNIEALCKIRNWINNADITNMGPRQSQNQDSTANQILMHNHIKYFTVVIGNTFARDVGLERKLEELIKGLQKVQTLEECDFILVFCLFDSQCGTDIQPSLNMLSSLPGNKDAVVLVLHYTSNPNTIVPDSSGAVNRNNTITVDLLFCKDMGLLTCYRNDEALSKVISCIKPEDITNMGPRQSQTDEHITNQLVKNQHPKYFTLVKGNTLGHHVSIERKLQELIPGLQKVQDLEDCDFSLVFCPVVSRAGTDTEAAVKKLNTLEGNHPTVLVVLHHTFDPESVVPDSSRRVNRENTVTVDCLFYEDQGLLHCSKNDEALSKVINWLQSEGILTKPAKQTQSITTDKARPLVQNWLPFLKGASNKRPNKHSNQDHTVHQLLKRHPLKHYSMNTGKTLGHDVGIERKLEQLVPGLQKVQKLEECDFILVFCPIVSRAGTDIEAAMKELNILSGKTLIILLK